ncbi:MAG TPA: gluconate 2-dehydrogenase subunit 3 family protein [Acidocella sp.]|jgi:hypothetical protein|nr:gluconate 2-dehydrogenase subunit 3 family protein [Acidocella sp.]
MAERFPGYDVLSKRAGLSWNDVTRRAVDLRLAVPREPRFFTMAEWAVLERVCSRILPQPAGRPPVPIAALIDAKMLTYGETGTRIEPMPWDGEAWKLALAALDGQADSVHHRGFATLDDEAADALLGAMQRGEPSGPAWARVPPALFFAKRLLPDITEAYYGHPTAWSEIGFGGPASPRGYVRMDTNRHDPWEAEEAKGDNIAKARRHNRYVG